MLIAIIATFSAFPNDSISTFSEFTACGTVVGIDVIGDFLTEINVTSPTGIREIQRLSGIDIAALTWATIETQRGSHASNHIAK